MATISESFNQADSTTLGPDLTWTEYVVDWSVVSNQASGVGTGAARAESDLASADHYAQATAINPGTNLQRPGVAVRFDSAANTFYGVWVRNSATVSARLFKCVAGTRTNLLDINNQAFVANDVVRLEVSGSTLTVYKNGVSIGTFTDTSIAGGTRTGICCDAGAASILDAFSAGDLGGSSTTHQATATGGTASDGAASARLLAAVAAAGATGTAGAVAAALLLSSAASAATVTGGSAAATLSSGPQTYQVTVAGATTVGGSATATATFAPTASAATATAGTAAVTAWRVVTASGATASGGSATATSLVRAASTTATVTTGGQVAASVAAAATSTGATTTTGTAAATLVPGAAARNITVTATLGPRRWKAHL